MPRKKKKTTSEENFWSIDEDTGELVPMMTVRIPEGTTIITPKQREVLRKTKEKKNTFSSGPKFFFLSADHSFGELIPQNISRLIYLYSFLNYKGVFMKNTKTQMKKKHLAEVLHVSSGVAYRFFDTVKDKYIKETPDGLINADDNIVFKGDLSVEKMENFRYVRMYTQAVKSLYKSAGEDEKKALGYLYNLIPCLSMEYNIPCKHVWREKITDITPMTITQVCDIFKYGHTAFKEMKTKCESMTIKYGKSQEKIIKFIDAPKKAKHMIVNPNLLYGGSSYAKVRDMINFEEVKNDEQAN